MVDERDFGSFAEAVTALGTLNKMESAMMAALATSKVPGRETRKFMKCNTPEEAMNTALFQFMGMLFEQIGLGTLKLSKKDIFNYSFVVPDSPVCKLYPNVTNRRVCYITAEALQQFFEADLGIPGNAEEVACRRAGDEHCEFLVSLQPLAVYQLALDTEDREIINSLMSGMSIDGLADELHMEDEEIEYRLDVLQRYHIINNNFKITEIGETYHRYGRGMPVLNDDFPPPWKDVAEISSSISASSSFAQAFLETADGNPMYEDVKDEEIVNLVEEAKKSASFAELLARSTKKEEKK